MTLLAAIASAQTAFDPLSIGVGARSMGMGKAFVAVAENADTIFSNPAGLGEIDTFEFTSMSGSLLEDVNYTVLGGVYPVGDKSAYGLGYAAAGVNGIQLRDAGGSLTGLSNFGSSVFLVSYGRKITKKFSFGLNFKYYSTSGYDVPDANGSGANLDIGFLQKGLGWLSFGAVAQNVLSSSRVRYSNKTAEPLPLSLKLGVRMFLAGEEFESAMLSPLEIILVSDADLSLQASVPTTTHLGLEISPSPNLVLRTGMDQDPVPGGIQTNFTYGLSLQLTGIGFHYAFHPYTQSPDNAAHYFSITFDERGWPIDGLPDIFLGSRQLPQG